MNILYIMKYPLEDDYDLKTKFDGQINAMTTLGHEVYYIAYDHKNVFLIHGKQKKQIKKILFGTTKFYIHTKAFYDLFKSVIRVVKEYNFEMVYFRLMPLSFMGIRMCNKLKKRGCKIVVEIPTYPPEKKRNASFVKELYIRYSDFCWRIINSKISCKDIYKRPC